MLTRLNCTPILVPGSREHTVDRDEITRILGGGGGGVCGNLAGELVLPKSIYLIPFSSNLT